MIRRDYLVKQLEEFGKVIARLIQLRTSGDCNSIEKEIEAAAQQFTDLEIRKIEDISPEALNALLLAMDDHKLKILADLLFEKLHLHILRGDRATCLQLKYRCMKMYDLVKARNPANFDMDVYYKVQFLQTV